MRDLDGGESEQPANPLITWPDVVHKIRVKQRCFFAPLCIMLVLELHGALSDGLVDLVNRCAFVLFRGGAHMTTHQPRMLEQLAFVLLHLDQGSGREHRDAVQSHSGCLGCLSAIS